MCFRCRRGAGAVGGAGGSNFGVSGSANGGSACEGVFNDDALPEDAKLTNILILCTSCYIDRIHSEE